MSPLSTGWSVLHKIPGRWETACTGITANAICPGWVLTPLVQQQIDKRIAKVCLRSGARAVAAEKQPSGEFVTPEQLRTGAVFM